MCGTIKCVKDMAPDEINRYIAMRVHNWMDIDLGDGVWWCERTGMWELQHRMDLYDPFHNESQAAEALLEFNRRNVWHTEIALLSGHEMEICMVREYLRDYQEVLFATNDGNIAPIICRAIVAAMMAEGDE